MEVANNQRAESNRWILKNKLWRTMGPCTRGKRETKTGSDSLLSTLLPIPSERTTLLVRQHTYSNNPIFLQYISHNNQILSLNFRNMGAERNCDIWNLHMQIREEVPTLHTLCTPSLITHLLIDKEQESEGDNRLLLRVEEDSSLQAVEVEAG